ncbi:MAG: nucleoside hydrolase [Planctomycetes bacterium]|nr:nucleoside hydrolase [Planctomycetota bacterium]
MARKLIIDTDPGIDDAVALTLALFDPKLDVVAVTAVGGNVPPEMASRNVQAIIEQLDPPRWPRTGSASAPDAGLPADARHIHGADGLGNAKFEVAELIHRHPAEKVICDEVRAAPDEVTILALGPLTNIARAFQRDPGLESQVGRLVIMGGAVTAPGNVTPAAEFNIYCDPVSARSVFKSRTTKTLIPLDVTNQVPLTYDLLDNLPPETSRGGAFLRRVLPHAFRSHRQLFGQEEIFLHDVVALVAVTHPELFETCEIAGDVETQGELTAGATLFDRRPRPEWRANMEIATAVDSAAVVDYIMRAMKRAGQV